MYDFIQAKDGVIMVRSLRSFLISFLFSLVAFAIAANYIFPFLNNLVLDVFNGNGAATEQGQNKDHENEDGTEDVPVNGTGQEAPDDVSGSTFETLFVITDKSRKYAEMITFVKADKENKRFVFSAIPATLKVNTSGAQKNPDGTPINLGSIYKDSGIEHMTELVSGIIGIDIDYYYVMSKNNFVKTIDALGAIPVDLKYDLVHIDDDYTVELTAGKQDLDGDKALQYITFADYKNGELDRLTVQIMLAKLAFNQYLTSDKYATCKEKFDEISKFATTNLSADEFARQAELLFRFQNYKLEPTVVFPTTTGTHEGGKVYYDYVPNAVLKEFEEYR